MAGLPKNRFRQARADGRVSLSLGIGQDVRPGNRPSLCGAVERTNLAVLDPEALIIVKEAFVAKPMQAARGLRSPSFI